MRNLSYDVDLCVVGGGMSGVCAAIAAARHGIKVVLVQDRPVLGGNASSEIRMWIGGAHGKDNREGGIIEEIFLENFYQNPALKYPLWDSVVYEKVMAEENITLLLNTSCLDATMDGNRIVSIKAWQSNAETFHTVRATYFADCSGDSILAPLTNAEFMYGREAKSDFGETIPPDVADKKTMGMSCLFQIRETDHPVVFTAPEWAYKYESDADLPYKDHDRDNNFWWIEIGGEWDCIHDTDKCRHELLKICYGVWDHMKNHGDHGVDKKRLEVTPALRLVSLDGEKIALTELELKLLTAIMSGNGSFVSRERLLEVVWENKKDVGIVNVYVHYLREKLEKNGEKIILSSRGEGYKISERYV